jgi:thioredoxin reductase (NADPH)
VALTLHERYHPPLLRVFTHLQAPAFSPELSAQLAQYGIPVIEGEILGFEGKARKEGLQAVLLKDARVEVQRLFVALGMVTWSDLASALGAHCSPDGYVLTDAHGQTSIPGFYAVGDVQHGLRRQIYTAWESAVAAVEHLDARLRAERRTATSAQR